MSQYPSLSLLPGDILYEISTYTKQAECLSFGLTSRAAWLNVAPHLYKSVHLNSGSHATLRMLSIRCDIARHVQRLTVHAESCSRAAVLCTQTQMVLPYLDALNSFTWEGEPPEDDDIWFVLRMRCPRLRRISITMGASLPPRHSHLFDFSGLTGFSVKLLPSFYREQHVEFFSTFGLGRSILRMLVQRCPNLGELHIYGSETPLEMHDWDHARWPELRSLILGDFLLFAPEGHEPYIGFLEAHPELTRLELSRHSFLPQQLAALAPESLAKVTHFKGTLDQLQHLPQIYERLQTLEFCDAVRTSELNPLALTTTLRRLPALKDLRLSFVLHSVYDSGTLLGSVTVSCPQITHLEVHCPSKAAAYKLSAFARGIRPLTKLRTFELSIMRFPGDDSLTHGACTIARTNPRLSSFKLSYIRPNSIPGSSGTYEVRIDQHGLPVALDVSERHRRSWFSRQVRKEGEDVYRVRMKVNLKPGGNRKEGLVALLTDPGSAGEDLRLIVGVGLLVLLTTWASICGATVNFDL